MAPCSVCPLGKYQPGSGATTCLTCDVGTTTNSTASSSPSACQSKNTRVLRFLSIKLKVISYFTFKNRRDTKEGNVLFNDALNTFYLRLYGRKEGNVLFNDIFNTFYLRLYGRKEMLYLTTHSTHFIYGYMASDIW